MPFFVYLIYIILIVGPIYLIWALYMLWYKTKKSEWMSSQNYTILQIDVPRMNEKSPIAAEQMFAALHGVYSESARFQYHISFEIVAKDKYIRFYVYLPTHLKDFVEGQIYAQYSNVEIKEVEDYTHDIDIHSSNVAIAEMKLNKPDVYPIKQFTDFEVDPISGVTSVMTKLDEGQEVWFQLVIRPVGEKWQERGHSRVNSVRSGSLQIGKGFWGWVLRGFIKLVSAFLVQAFRPAPEDEKKKKDTKLSLPASVEEALKSIELKITKLGFESRIRIVSVAEDQTTAVSKCRNVVAAFKQFNTNNLNGFKMGEIKINNKTEWNDYIFRSFENDGYILNIAEIASLYHFPSSSVATPNIVWSGSKKSEPPANLPIRANTSAEDFTVLGETNFRNASIEFGIKRDDRRRHIYIVGKSGVGKSVLIENMAINDVIKNSGVIIVDPHGELADKVMACIPDDRINDVIVFDPSDREFPIAFNLLEAVDDDFKSLVASGFVGIFKKIFGNSWGPRLEHILRNTVLALLDCPGSTMLDIPRMLTNNRFRDKVLEHVKDTVIREFWLNEFGSFDAKFRTEAVAPILNKVGQFLASSTIRNIVGQPKSRIDIRQIMDQQKIMIVNLSRGKIGEDNSALLGAMMITKIQLAAMSRANVTNDKRPDCFLYVDEFQNFATDAFGVILSEARKYNLALTMAHQYIKQLPEELGDAIFGNAGTIISFRVGGADADVLVKEYEPVFTNNDLVNLDKYNIYIKLLVDGISAPAFSAKTLPPVQKLSGNAEKVMIHSRSTYSVARVDVEAAINGQSSSEETELKAEAELFKKGGLEALLVKKGPNTKDAAFYEAKQVAASETQNKVLDMIKGQQSNTSQNMEAQQVSPVKIAPVVKETALAEESAPHVENAEIKPQVTATDDIKQPPTDFLAVADIADQQSEYEQEEKKPKELKPIKYQNILAGKLYKERTARGGVKWFLGEEIDEEKLEKSGTIIDDTARELIELSKNIAEDNKNQNKKQKKHRSEQGNGGSQTISEKPIDQQKPEVKVPSNNQVVESNNNLPIIEDNLPVAITPSLPIEEHLATPVILETKKSVPAEDASEKKVEVEDGKLSSNTNNTTTIPAAKTLEEGTAIKL
jgi:hypothetical protein